MRNVLTVLQKVSQSPFGHIVQDYPKEPKYNKIQISQKQKYEPSVEHWADD